MPSTSNAILWKAMPASLCRHSQPCVLRILRVGRYMSPPAHYSTISPVCRQLLLPSFRKMTMAYFNIRSPTYSGSGRLLSSWTRHTMPERSYLLKHWSGSALHVSLSSPPRRRRSMIRSVASMPVIYLPMFQPLN